MKKSRILVKERRLIGKQLYPLTSVFYDCIPLDKVDEILRSHGYLILQEDNTPWSGFLCGRDENTLFTLGILDSRDEHGRYQPLDETHLYFSWYKHETGRYEINMYLT